MKTTEQLVDELIDLAFAEDIGDGDHTTLCCIPATAMGKSKLLIKEPGVLAGVEVAREIFHRFDPELKMTYSHQMIRLIFTEQLYRAMTILNNEPYHHE